MFRDIALLSDKNISSAFVIPNTPITSVQFSSVVVATSSKVSFNSLAPPPPILQGCFPNVTLGMSVEEVNSSCSPVRSICFKMDCQTNPCDGLAGVLGSPLIPSTALTVSVKAF